MSTAFADVTAWPSSNTGPAQTGHNKPPLDESVVADFMEGLTADGITKRIDEMVARGNAAGDCTNDETAGRYADFSKMVRSVLTAVEEHRERHNRPILNAQRALKGKADGVVAPVIRAGEHVRRKLDAYVLEKRRQEEEARRAAEDAARKARIAAEEAARAAIEDGEGDVIAPMPEIEVQAAPVEAPQIRGDYGARVGFTTVHHHEIQSVRQLPDRLLKHPKVVEVLNKLIAAEVKAAKGKIEIKGVRVWSEQATAVR